MITEKLKDLFSDIQSSLDHGFEERKIVIFLCGGKNDGSENIRNKVFNALSGVNKIKFIYAENVVDTYLKEKKGNLVELEKFIFENTDITLLIPESAGSFCELGLFIMQNDNYLKKLFVFNDKNFLGETSFINDGPIKYLKNVKESKNVHYLNDETFSKRSELLKYLRVNELSVPDGYGLLMKLYYLVFALIFYGQELTFGQIKKILLDFKQLIPGLESIQDFDMLIFIVRGQLVSDKFLTYTKYHSTNEPQIHSLTDIGETYFVSSFNVTNTLKRSISPRFFKYLSYNYDY